MNKYYFLLLVLLHSSFLMQAQSDLANVSLEIPTVTALPGEEICLDITAANFDGIFGLSFTLLFDDNALEFVEIKDINLPSASLNDNFNILNAGDGEIAMLWTSLSTEIYPKPFSLFTICFKVIGTEGNIAPIQFANDPVGVEIIGDAASTFEDFVQGKFTNGAVWIQSGVLPDIPGVEREIKLFSCEEVWKAELDISVSGGVAPYRYNWSGPNDFQSIEEDLPLLDFGVYSLTVTDQNETPGFFTFYVIKPQSIGDPKPLIDSLVVGAAFNCGSPDGVIEIFLSQEIEYYSFNWSNGATTQHLYGVEPGPYEVTIVDSRGCTDLWSGEIPDSTGFEVTTEISPAICMEEKGKAEVTSPLGDDYEYTWFDGSNGTSIESLPPGNYGLTVTNTSTGCVEPVSFLVTKQGDIPLTIETVALKCDGTPGSIQLQLPNESLAIEWNTGEQTALINDLPAGDYVVTVTDPISGCVREEQVELRIPEIRVITQTDCRLSDIEPDSVYATVTPLTGIGPYTFNWSNGETIVSDDAGTLGAPLPTVLFATVTDQEGCVGYSAPTVSCREEDQQANFNTTLYYECADQPFFTAYIREGGVAPYTFKWNTGFQETGEQSSAVPVSGGGFTAVTVTDADGKTDILVAHPLPIDACSSSENLVELIVPDTIVEVDEPFFLPLVLNSPLDLDDLKFELHWDARHLQLDGISGEGLTLNTSVADINLSGKTQLVFDFSFGQPAAGPLAILEFTPKGTEEVSVPILLGYSKWLAVVDEKDFFITPQHGSVTIIPDGTKVWPGDTDQSRKVDHNDLLNIGLAYNTTGTIRPNASLEWQGQYSPAWGVETPESNVDHRHIDTNGDGLISDADTVAIAQNWSLVTTHVQEPTMDQQPGPKSTGVPLWVEGSLISSDQDNRLPIVLGAAGQLAENIYGLAFSLSYQGFIATQNIYVDFTDSWLGQDDTPLLTLYRHFPEENRLDIALVRTNGQSVSGSGTIAHLILRGNNRTGSLQTATVETLDAKMIDEQEQLLQTALESTQLEVDFSSGITEPAWARAIQISPVPASTELHIHTDGLVIEGVQVINLQGQPLTSYLSQAVLPIQYFAAGVYLLRIQTPQGVVVRRWVKQ